MPDDAVHHVYPRAEADLHDLATPDCACEPRCEKVDAETGRVVPCRPDDPDVAIIVHERRCDPYVCSECELSWGVLVEPLDPPPGTPTCPHCGADLVPEEAHHA